MHHLFQMDVLVNFLFLLAEDGFRSLGGSVVNSKWVVIAPHCVVESFNVNDINGLAIFPRQG